MNFKEKYGPVALIAGASEGLGAAYAHALAARGLDVIMVARRKEPLKKTADEIRRRYNINVSIIVCDLVDTDAPEQIQKSIGDTEVNFLVYNAASSYIGPFLKLNAEDHLKITAVNMITPLKMTHIFGGSMVQRRRGGIVLMASLAGFQGSGFLTTYGATKAFNRVLAEGLWYEWKKIGVEVIACCAGATATPGYFNSKPKKLNFFAPKVQTPEEVVEECLYKIGMVPSFISGGGNKIASFFMSKLFSRKQAVNIMGDTTRKMYGVND